MQRGFDDHRARSGLRPGSQVERAKKLYAVDEWPQGARRAGVPLGEIKLEGYTAGPVRHIDGRITRRFEGTGKLPPFIVDLEVKNTALEAHEVLVTWLATTSKPQKIPTSNELGMPLGDAGYVGLAGPGPGAIAWMAFTRGNIVVNVVAVDPREWPRRFLHVVAQTIDKQIVAQPALDKGDAVPYPAIRNLRADRDKVRAGDTAVLELDVVDPAGGEASIVWLTGGDGQGYVERRNGVWKLFTTGAGKLLVEAEVTGRMGTTTTKQIELQVSDQRR